MKGSKGWNVTSLAHLKRNLQLRVKSNPALSHYFLKDSKLNPNTTNHSRTLSSLLVCTLISTWLLQKISLPLIGCSNFFR